jgi:hypothetical protein
VKDRSVRRGVVAAAWPSRSAEKLDAAYLARSSKIRKVHAVLKRSARSADRGRAQCEKGVRAVLKSTSARAKQRSN